MKLFNYCLLAVASALSTIEDGNKVETMQLANFGTLDYWAQIKADSVYLDDTNGCDEVFESVRDKIVFVDRDTQCTYVTKTRNF